MINDLPPDAAIILFVTAFLATSYRCFARYRGGLWWHDDSFALFSALSFILRVIGSYHTYFRLSVHKVLVLTFPPSVTLGLTLIADGVARNLPTANCDKFIASRGF